MIHIGSAIKAIIANTKIDKSQRNIILSHQFFTNLDIAPITSDSENLTLGGLENVDISVFDDFDYVALGHIHRPQKLKRDTARYAGSILKYSFSEARGEKSMPVLDFKKELDFNLQPLIPLKDMRIIEGNIEKLLDKEIYSTTNTDDYIMAVLTNEEDILDPIGKLRSVYKNVLKIEIKNKKNTLNVDSKTVASGNIKERSVINLFEEFYENQNNISLSKAQKEYLDSVISEVKHEAN